MSEPHSSIVQALVAVSKDVGAVRKESYNQGQHFNFRGIDAVTMAVYPAFLKHGIVYCPQVEHVEYAEKHLKNGSAATSVRLTVNAIFLHTSGESLLAVVQAEAFDMGDKATAKAMSVAMRTALLQVLCLPTDEPDPDSDSYEIATAPTTTPTPKKQEITWEQVATCTNIKQLRNMWIHATSELREGIENRVKQLQANQTEEKE